MDQFGFTAHDVASDGTARVDSCKVSRTFRLQFLSFSTFAHRLSSLRTSLFNPAVSKKNCGTCNVRVYKKLT